MIKVYSTPTCKYCTVVKNFLKEKGVSFVEVDLTQSPNDINIIVSRTGRRAVPVTHVISEGVDEMIVGGDESALKVLSNYI